MELNIFDVAVFKGINVQQCEEIKVEPLTADLKEAIKNSGLCSPSRCFNNIWSIVYEGVALNAEFVLAIASDVIPIEHAILYLDGKYYDPTWELHLGHLGKEYLRIIQLDQTNLVRVAKNASVDRDGIYAPMINDLRKLVEFEPLFKEAS